MTTARELAMVDAFGSLLEPVPRRERIATAAAAALLVADPLRAPISVARDAVEYADALIAELDQT